LSRHRLRLAELPLALLVTVGLAFPAGLVAILATSTLPPDPLGACVTVAATLMARLTTVGLLAPLGILCAVVLASLLALSHQLWATRRVLGKILQHRVATPAQVLGAAREAGVARLDVVADRGVFVFCHGFLRPGVCLSLGCAELLAQDELAAVLRHEAHHARHRDPLKILLGRTVASGLFFLPVAGALRNGFLTGKEICADRAAQRVDDALALPRALVKMLQADRPSWPAGVLAIGSLSPTEARIVSLIEPDRSYPTLPRALDWIVTLAVTAGIFGFSLGSAAAAKEDSGVFAHCSPAATLSPAWAALASAEAIPALP
jgi:Zn-dependent protease with chaperone function